MKSLSLLMAGAAVMALTLSARAATDAPDPTGWYIGLGAGWTMMDGTANFTSIPDRPLAYQGDIRISGTAGYKWSNGWRA